MFQKSCGGMMRDVVRTIPWTPDNPANVTRTNMLQCTWLVREHTRTLSLWYMYWLYKRYLISIQSASPPRGWRFLGGNILGLKSANQGARGVVISLYAATAKTGWKNLASKPRKRCIIYHPSVVWTEPFKNIYQLAGQLVNYLNWILYFGLYYRFLDSRLGFLVTL